MNVRGTSIGALLILAALLAGCAASGPAYQEAAAAPPDRGLVYIYRPGKFIGGAVGFDVHAGPETDNRELVTLRSGGYFPYYAAPGELELWSKTESRSSVTVDVHPGETIYVRGSIGVGVLVGRPSLEIVDAATGQQEIRECKLLEAAASE